MKIFAKLTKVDEASRVVYGRAVQEVVDRSREIFDYKKSKPRFQQWSADIAKATDGKSLGNVRAMHGKVAAGKLTDIIFHDDEMAIDVSAKIVDDNEWKKVVEGVYTGFSMGGDYGEKWDDPEHKGVTRYEAIPAEISLVDNPCIPTATFMYVKAAGGSEMRKFVEKTSDANFHKQKSDDHRKMAAQAAKDGDNAAADKHNKAADLHGEAAEHYGKAGGETDTAKEHGAKAKTAGAAANKASDDAGEYKSPAQRNGGSQATEHEGEEKPDAEKAAVNELAALLNGGKVKASDLLAVAKEKAAVADAGRAFQLRRALLNPELTNGDVEKLAEQLPEAQRAGATVADLLKHLDTAALPFAEYLTALSAEAKTGAPEAVAKKYAPDILHAEIKDPASAGDVIEKMLKQLPLDEKTKLVKAALAAKFADPANKKYPIDTSYNIRASWKFINGKAAGAKYSKDELATMKTIIAEAWKLTVDASGPPAPQSADKSVSAEALRKGLYGVAQMSQICQQLWDMQRQCEAEQSYEEDEDSQLPARLEALAVEAGEILCEMAEEETQEEAAEKAAFIAGLRKEFVGEHPHDLVKQLLAKYGARHSKEDGERLQKIHDHSVDMGAKCADGADNEKIASHGPLRKALGLSGTTTVDALLKHAADLVRKAGLYDKAPAPAKGMLKVVTKEGDDGATGGGEPPKELKDLMEKAQKGDPVAQMRLVHMRPSVGGPVGPTK